MNPEMFNGVVTFVVGLAALAVYWLGKHSDKKNAASIIVMDIRSAEQVVISILEKGSVDYTTKNILSENNWRKYKHLFASDFSYDDFAAFNHFFDACAEISDARNTLRDIFFRNLIEKTAIAQQMVCNVNDINCQEGQTKRQTIIDKLNAETYVFDPNEPKVRAFQNLQLMGRLTNTIAFEKLKRKAGIKM
jgi:hypothetical protein